MASDGQRRKLRELVGELNAVVEVRDPEAATDVLTANVTSRNIANVTALTNKRKLSERSSDPQQVDALYAELKASGQQPVTDRFINVLLKLREAPELLAVIADSEAADSQLAAAAAPAPAPAPAPLTAAEARSQLSARLGAEGVGAQIPEPEPEGAPRVPAAVAAATPAKPGAPAREEATIQAPVLAARNLGLQSNKGLAVPVLPDWTRDRPFLTGDFARLAVDSPLLLPLPDASQRPAPMPISTFPHAVQEIMLVEELLSALTGIEGKYIRASVRNTPAANPCLAPLPAKYLACLADGCGCAGQTSKLGRLSFSVDAAIDPSLADLTARILPLATHAHAVSRYVDVHSRFEYGLVCHAFCAALRNVLKE